MARFRNVQTGVVVSVDDSKADRYSDGWESADEAEKKAPAKKSAPSKSKK